MQYYSRKFLSLSFFSLSFSAMNNCPMYRCEPLTETMSAVDYPRGNVPPPAPRLTVMPSWHIGAALGLILCGRKRSRRGMKKKGGGGIGKK